MAELSVIIPSRNEQFLQRTIEDILQHAEGDTEVIAVLDGQWADPPIEDHPRVTLVYHSVPVGQRAACNEAVRIATGKYVLKCDAHCAFDQGFDVKLMADMQDDWTVVPVMKNLHVFDWVCPNGHRRYQGLSGPCKECGEQTVMDVVWIAKKSPNSHSYCFDSEPHFQYFGEFSKRPEGQGDLTETMSLQGSCFMLTKERYQALNVCDETWGIWGSQGIEVACKTWLSGGRVLCNHKTWYAHCFRTKGGDFGFPYELPGSQVGHAKKMARQTFFENAWEHQVHPLSWLVEKFWPVKGWTEEELAKIKEKNAAFAERKAMTRRAQLVERRASCQSLPMVKAGMIYYSDCQLDPAIAQAVRSQLQRISTERRIPIVSATLKKMEFGEKNIHFPSYKRGYLSMFKQIRAALEHSKADFIFFVEHDVLYSDSHFDFVPPEKDRFYYNTNFWKVDAKTGKALHYDAMQTSGLCAYRELLLEEYGQIIAKVEKDGYSTRTVSFEPGSRDGRAESWQSQEPILDIRHDGNLTPSRWSRDQFRDKSSCQGWAEADHVDGWYEAGKFGELIHVESVR